MTSPRVATLRSSATLRIAFLVTTFVMLAIAFAVHAAPPSPADSLPEGDKACLGCHAMDGMKKDLASGEALSLHISGDAFARSVHKLIGCQGCHTQVKLPDHPGNGRTIKGSREYTIAQTETCRSCHDRIFKTYEGSMHATRLREGNTAAPTCADCHRPHEITAASVQDGPKNACVTCHGDVSAGHSKWLPNAGRHMEAVACSGCHAPDALRKVDLRLQDNRTHERLVDRDGSFEKRARAVDVNGDGLDAMELRTLIADMNRGGADVSLRGHIELRNGVDAHELPFKPNAVKDCITCHREGMAQFQRVTVSALDAQGRPLRYDAHGEVLSSVLSVNSVPGFYAIGGTRIKFLDVLLGLALVAGLSVPALHLLVRRFLGRRARKNGEEK